MGSFITLAKKDRGSVAFRCKPSFYSMDTRTETMETSGRVLFL